jgi:ferredoxin-NADP reductase
MTATGALQPPRIGWRVAEVRDVVRETADAVTLELDVPGWPGHRAGQHVDVRLTADDGYQAQRSYSIASAPEAEGLAITIERLEDGEVSPYLVEELRAGDPLELRGPIGGWFTWEVSQGGPLLLLAGGSGLVPLMAMLRHRRLAGGGDVPAQLLLSVRRPGDLLYADELAALGDDALARLARFAPEDRPRVFACGPTAFVEAVADTLVALGHDPSRIRTERFGATGG